MKVLIYGGGSVGLGIASCLLKSGSQVDILARETTIFALRQAGLTRTGIFGDYHAAPSSFGCFSSLSEVQAAPYDFILVCTKSFDSGEAAGDLSQHELLFADETRIVLFQNGWGNAERFLPFFSKDRVYSARVITGFRRPHDNEVNITVHADSIHLGSLFGCDLSCLKDLALSITEGGIPCEITDSIERDLWAKMLYNCALNPLGAVLDVPYGALAEYEYTRQIMNGIVEEVFNVMERAGYKTHWQSPADFLEVFYAKLVPDTAGHKSSTLQDILARKKTEIDALNGAVIKLAEKCKTQVPYNLVVYNMVKSIENR
ncbi:MAG TPA: 2-dehydropantoate 2-reductase [Sedimentisphaerales bacterium]|nr:2-dehydropantoate 2-reductase [Sedimentisphaerales bacterium]